MGKQDEYTKWIFIKHQVVCFRHKLKSILKLPKIIFQGKVALQETIDQTDHSGKCQPKRVSVLTRDMKAKFEPEL